MMHDGSECSELAQKIRSERSGPAMSDSVIMMSCSIFHSSFHSVLSSSHHHRLITGSRLDAPRMNPFYSYRLHCLLTSPESLFKRTSTTKWRLLITNWRSLINQSSNFVLS